MYPLLRSLLFSLPPEMSHHLSLMALQTLAQCQLLKAPTFKNKVSTKIMAIDFPNPVGLAAGFDKNGDYLEGLQALGFGFIEIGTLTPKPQPGNPKPRLFRLKQDQALINRMGFNNKGIDYAIKKIQKSTFSGVLGINIGKNKETPLHQAIDDYLYCFRKAYTVADYITVNLSSPNTPGLRLLQSGEALQKLLSTLKKEQLILSEQHKKYTPLVIKVAPDLTKLDCLEMANQFIKYRVDGIIATNTTTQRYHIQNKFSHEQGGLSGAPLTQTATEVLSWLSEYLEGTIPIIGVGGIMSSEGAIQKMQQGASLIQLYTGFVFHGPALIKSIEQELTRLPY